MKLVDTSAWIEYLRGCDNTVADRVRDLMRGDEHFTTIGAARESGGR